MNDESKSLIIPDQLRVAREDLALSVAYVARTLGIKEEELVSWEKGRSEPPVEQLWELADLYQRSTDYFLRPTPSFPAQVNFRLDRWKAMREMPVEVRKVFVRFDELCRAESELEKLLERPRRVLLERVRGEWTPNQLATMERKRLGLDENPILDLRGVLTDQGIRIFELPAPKDELSGLSWWHDVYGPCIFVNALDNAGRRSFTLAHEYAHILLSDPPTVCNLKLDIPEERFATKFAAVFLMPASDLKSYFLKWVGPPGTVPSDKQLGTLAGRYHVSLEALGRRLEELKLLPEGTTDLRIAEWEAKPRRYRGKKGPKWQHQLGEKFVSLGLEAHSQGYISASKLAQYLGVDVRKALEAAEGNKTPSAERKDG